MQLPMNTLPNHSTQGDCWAGLQRSFLRQKRLHWEMMGQSSWFCGSVLLILWVRLLDFTGRRCLIWSPIWRKIFPHRSILQGKYLETILKDSAKFWDTKLVFDGSVLVTILTCSPGPSQNPSAPVAPDLHINHCGSVFLFSLKGGKANQSVTVRH